MKSAWEKALEKLDDAGIERPDPASLKPEHRDQMDQVRARAQAQLAELEIMFKKAWGAADPAERSQLEANYDRDRDRIESRRDRELEKIRSAGRP